MGIRCLIIPCPNRTWDFVTIRIRSNGTLTGERITDLNTVANSCLLLQRSIFVLKLSEIQGVYDFLGDCLSVLLNALFNHLNTDIQDIQSFAGPWTKSGTVFSDCFDAHFRRAIRPWGADSTIINHGPLLSYIIFSEYPSCQQYSGRFRARRFVLRPKEPVTLSQRLLRNSRPFSYTRIVGWFYRPTSFKPSTKAGALHTIVPEYSRFSDRVILKHYQTGPVTLFIDVSVHCCTVLSFCRSLAQDIHNSRE